VKAKHVSSITQLAREIGISRQWCSGLFRMTDHPKPTRFGHNVAAWKKYLSRRAEKIQSAGSEKSRLELELLRRRLARVNLEIMELDGSRREEIANEITSGCLRVVDTLKSRLWRMPDELAGILSALGEPMLIYKRLKAELGQRFGAAYDELHKVKQTSRRKDNLVPFRPVKVTGDGANGAKRA
jgi:hypothetical protein